MADYRKIDADFTFEDDFANRLLDTDAFESDAMDDVLALAVHRSSRHAGGQHYEDFDF
tara:strand:+ start:2157 stop:2330 length:174 start_codon:yes stop_codon:yes gene_type:complete